MFSKRADPGFARKPRAPLSITARLALLYAVSASLMLFAITATIYYIQMQSTERDDFSFVLDKVYRLERALQEHPDEPGILEQEVKWRGYAPGAESNHIFYSRILDAKGQVIVESPDLSASVRSVLFPPPVDLRSSAKPMDAVQRWRSPEGKPYCVLSSLARSERSAESWVIQVAMDDAEDDEVVANVQRAMLLALLLGTLCFAGLGGVVARRGMKPLREIAAAAERVTVSELNERIDPECQPKELATLATALNRMLGRLEDSFIRMSQFAADMAHELRTPIHNMMVEAEVALSAERKPEEYRSILESSLEEFQRLSGMINEMLFLARAEDPQQQIERVRLDARREIDAVREFFDALTESRGVTVSAQGRGDIDANPLLFRRAMTNVLSNALRHTPNGGKIAVSIEQASDNTVLVRVKDSGSGIRQEHLPRICDRLYCADRTNAELSEQTGLGLSIVKSIIELHGGSIAVNSALGKGTTVLMRFPAPAPAAT